MGAEQGAQWWADVSAELDAVIAAPDSAAAAGIIAWWHHDWSMVGQTPKRVAGRIRHQATCVLNSRRKTRAGGARAGGQPAN